MLNKYVCLFLVSLIAACSSSEATVKPLGFEEPTREELKEAMHYHGVQFAEQDNDGKWYFYRDGKRCRLFAYLDRSQQQLRP